MKQMKKSDEKKNVPKTKHFNDKGEPIPVINELAKDKLLKAEERTES